MDESIYIPKDLREEWEKKRDERLKCPFCNPHTLYGASPEFFDQWRIFHDYHKTPAILQK